MLDQVKQTILVLSGKGGVGKSTVSVQLALSLASQGKKVGLLDIDLCGPSIPIMLGLTGEKVTQGDKGWIPVKTQEVNLTVMSIGFLLSSPDSAVIWRGPKKTAMIRQFVQDVDWGCLDFLIIDTPPGTSDEHISVVETLKSIREPEGAILVSTPQAMSVADVRREIAFCRKAEVPILGIIENMSGYVCPHCTTCTNVFSSGGAESLAKLCEVPFLGSIPIDPKLGELSDLGDSYSIRFSESATGQTVNQITQQLMKAS